MAVVASGLAVSTSSCQFGDEPTGETILPVLVLDPGLSFYSFKCNDEPAFDPAGDQSNATQHRDIVGVATEEGAAMYYASDATRLYLRVRLDGDPRTNDPTNLKSFGWAFLFDTEERGDPSIPEYERLLHLNGTGGVDKLSLFDNVDFVENDPADPAENENTIYTPVEDEWVVDLACDSSTETCFSDDDDFFLTMAVAWSDLEDDQPPWVTAAILRSAATILTVGTTVSNNSIDADYVCFNNAVGFPGLDDIPNDPVALSCGNGLVDVGEACDDGNVDDGDGCTGLCLLEDGEPCTDNSQCLSGVCDDLSGICGSRCDNDVLEGTEGCDDGNRTPGDGCGATCLIETDFPCNDDPAGLVSDDSCESGICDDTEPGAGQCEDADTCGNSITEAGEDCDDGNTADGDGCDSNCVLELVCGTGILQVNEGCDDGNNTDNDGCNAGCFIEDGNACNANPAGLLGSASCASGICDLTEGVNGVCEPANTCGNSVLEAGEGCDDGNTDDTDGCSATCFIEDDNTCNIDPEGVTGDASCASGICDETEGTNGTCEPADTCGNGVLETGEGCDDGNTTDSDGCSATCFLEDGETCNTDTAGETGDASCASNICDTSGGGAGTCEPADTCGNNVLEAGEGCDDGNTADTDGCSAACLLEDGEACNDDTAGNTGDDSCQSGVCDTTEGGTGICEAADTCGNNVLETGEGCDDGNTDADDGCNASCFIENNNACNDSTAGETGDNSCASGICDTSGGGAGTCEAADTCGNNVLETGEGCDDGNTTPADGCDANCLLENGETCNEDTAGNTGDDSCQSGVCDTSGGGAGTCEAANSCGNNVLEAGEGCDDGNTADADGCSATCLLEDGETCNEDQAGNTGNDSCASGICDTTEGGAGTCEAANSCGNNVLETGEGCDDGNTAAGDGCDANCLLEDGETCNEDQAGNTGDQSCASGICDESEGGAGVCEPSGCGNGVLEAAEGCDDGNNTAGDGCAANCFLEDGETCNDDTAGQTGDDSCESGICDETEGGAGTCEPADTCGNGVLESGEGCDDGNTDDGDGCTAACLLEDGEGCNDDDAGETGDDSCDSGICDETEGGSGVCEPAGCGNNRLEGGEGCDDGNTVAGDGCSADCLIEDGNECLTDDDGVPDSASCESSNCDSSGTCNQEIGVSGGGCSSTGTQSASAGLLVALAMLWLLVAPARRRRLALGAGRRARGPIVGSLLAVALMLSATPKASAQEVIDQGFALERFRLSSQEEGFLNVEWGGILSHLEWDMTLWLGASDDPLVVFTEQDGERDRLGSLVSHRVGGTLMGAIGLYNRFQVTLEVPLIMSQDEETFDEVMPGLSSFGLGDLRVAPKVLLLSQRGLHLSVIAAVTLPTGGGDAFRGDDNVTFAPEAALTKELGPWRLSGNLGYKVRENKELPALGVGDELFANVGASYRFDHAGTLPLETGLTVATGTRASDPYADFNSNQLELVGGASYRFTPKITGVLAAGLGLEEGYGTPDWRAVLGVRWRTRTDPDTDGDGLVDKEDDCPTEPEDVDTYKDSDGCPDPDNDSDQVADINDGAPMDPEDRDGFEDEDGVPDPDNDKDGFADADDTCPNEAETVNGIEDEDGCPDNDADGDKIADKKDQCPQEPEDFDKFEDEDGCPELDNDKDTVVDAQDRCVNTPGVPENQGCPDTDRDKDTVVDRLDNCPDEPGPPENQGCKNKQLVKISKNRIELLEVVYFQTARARIRRRSYALLDNVASVLNAHTQVAKVRVEGHTDNRGNDAYNKDLSDRRAKAVVEYLISKGVAADRLEGVGFGEERPIADNKTRQGRAKNRRVEFVIVENTGATKVLPKPEAKAPAKDGNENAVKAPE